MKGRDEMNATNNFRGMATGAVAFAAENERLLEKVRAGGIDAQSFDGWKSLGKWVKKGERRKSFQVKSGVRRVGMNPITGEDEYTDNIKTAYGFTADQVK